MNQQRVSEICFDEGYAVAAHETARSLFSELPGGSTYARSLIECMATVRLAGVAESICMREMHRHIDATTDVLVGRSIRVEHLVPIPPGSHLRLRGWVTRIGDRSAAFCVQVRDHQELVSELDIALVSIRRTLIEARAAAKTGAFLHQIGLTAQRLPQPASSILAADRSAATRDSLPT